MSTMTKARAVEWGDYLRAAMDARGVTQSSDLASALGVDGSLVSRWLSNKAKPSVPHLRTLAKRLEIPLADLLVASGQAEAEEFGIAEPVVPAMRGIDRYPDIIEELEDAPDEIVEALRAVLRACRAVRDRVDWDAQAETFRPESEGL